MKKIKLNIQMFASTNKTTNYELPQFIGTDKPSWLGDFNEAMSTIDTGMHDNATAIDGVESASQTATSTANQALQGVSSLSDTVSSQGSAITTINSTLTSQGTAISSIDGRVTTLETDNVNIKNKIETNSTYSTEELMIGYWTNGKPLYRTVFPLTTITNTNTTLVDTSSMNIRQVVKVYGMLNTDNSQHFPMPLGDSASNYSVIYATADSIRGRASFGTGNFASGWVAIEYTKSTD